MTKRTDAIAVSRGAEGGQSVSASTSSVATTNAIGSDECLVLSDVACFAVTGASPTATVTNGTPIPANQLVRLHSVGADNKLAFITASGTGTVYVRPGA